MRAIRKVWEYGKAVVVPAAATGAMLVAEAANAALPDGVDTAITGIQTDGLALITAVTAVVVAFLAPKVIVKLVKRFTGML